MTISRAFPDYCLNQPTHIDHQRTRTKGTTMNRPYRLRSIESTFKNANQDYKLSDTASQAERLMIMQQRCTFDLMLFLNDEITKLVAEIVHQGDAR
jgi:hypothetical protein